LIGFSAGILLLGDLIDKRRKRIIWPGWLVVLVLPIFSLFASLYIVNVNSNGFQLSSLWSLVVAVLVVLGSIIYVFILVAFPDLLLFVYDNIKRIFIDTRDN
jgi:hypothetical protein